MPFANVVFSTSKVVRAGYQILITVYLSYHLLRNFKRERRS
jgi:hypothetical protein